MLFIVFLMLVILRKLRNVFSIIQFTDYYFVEVIENSNQRKRSNLVCLFFCATRTSYFSFQVHISPISVVGGSFGPIGSPAVLFL